MANIELVVFDLDGTIRDCSHRLHHIVREPGDDRPKDWDAFFTKCGGDVPIQHIIDTAKSFRAMGHTIAFWTGATEVNATRGITLSWLNSYGLLPCFELRMRQKGDYRHDDVLKAEWLEETRQAGNEVILSFEDRRRVVDMWRENGVPCVQVAPGDF